jgi:hypothetical protein
MAKNPVLPPTDPAECIGWVKEAVSNGRHIIDDHYYKRCQERGFSTRVWRRVLYTAISCTQYIPDKGPLAGGTSWRIIGLDFDGKEAAIGVETFVDHLGRRVLIITVF